MGGLKWLVAGLGVCIFIAIIVIFTYEYIISQYEQGHLLKVNNHYDFDQNRAMNDLKYQVKLGPRIPGSEAHQKAVDWISSKLFESGWQVENQDGQVGNIAIKNVIGRTGQGSPWLLIGAHYDSRMLADRDPDIEKTTQPVPGANDGASGVAILLEIARILPGMIETENLSGEVWLVFFDAEDNGNIDNYSWTMGSDFFVSRLTSLPDAVVILDMVGDSQLEIYKEKNSDPELADEIWSIADSIGYEDYFIPESKFRILDDHIPFVKAGGKAVDIIDFDYPYWHTVSDTVDKISSQSLEIVGDTMIEWLWRSLAKE